MISNVLLTKSDNLYLRVKLLNFLCNVTKVIFPYETCEVLLSENRSYYNFFIIKS